MEVYILDPLFRRTEVVDRFESCIWTERHAAFGDFDLSIHSTNETRSLLTPGTHLAINESYRVMAIETVENKNDSEGRQILNVTGRSLESILENRANRTNFPNGAAALQTWTLTNTPAGVLRHVFDSVCRTNTNIPTDNIPLLTTGTLYPPTTIAEPSEVVTMDIPIGTLYSLIKEICDVYGLGFRLYRGLDTSQLYFEIYTGNDRTTSQNDLTPVIFSPHLENLTEVSELTSIEQTKNVAYVFAPNGSTIVYATGVDSTVSGFSRRVIHVDANDIDLPAGAELTAALERRGLDALAKARTFQAIDGQVPQYSRYRYGIDYNLGDLVEMRNADGVTSNMRVTEQIFVSDAQGDRSYPTLENELFITPGSWAAWDFNQTWSELGTTEYWANQP